MDSQLGSVRARSCALLLAALFLIPTTHAGATLVPKYFNLSPGGSTKAEVDVNLGEPVRKLEEQVYEYTPPRDVTDTARVVVTFFPEARQVARIDVYLKAPVPPDAFRQQFGNRVMLRDRTGGGAEEIFYPRVHALIFAGKSSGEPVAAVSYLSPRYLADLYIERFSDLMRQKH